MNNLIIDLHNSCFTSMYDVYIVKVCGCNIYICIYTFKLSQFMVSLKIPIITQINSLLLMLNSLGMA